MPSKNEYGLTPQQEVFAHEVAKGKSLSDAYRAAYKTSKMKPEVVNVKASELAANGTVSVRVGALRAAAADRAELDSAEIIRGFRQGFGKVSARFRQGSTRPYFQLACWET